VDSQCTQQKGIYNYQDYV